MLAWVLVRYRFPGKALSDALVDLPFALPTAVAGIALDRVYAQNGWIGQLESLGIKVAFTPLGVLVALIFIGLPFVVRTVQPVLEDSIPRSKRPRRPGARRAADDPAGGAARRCCRPCLTGFALAFARAVGEYGSMIFIAGNMPMVTEIAPLLIITKLEQYDYAGATAIGRRDAGGLVRDAADHQRPAGVDAQRSGSADGGITHHGRRRAGQRASSELATSDPIWVKAWC